MKKNRISIAVSILFLPIVIIGGVLYWQKDKQDGKVDVVDEVREIPTASINENLGVNSKTISDFSDQSTWVKYSKKELKVALKHPRGWFEETSTNRTGDVVNKSIAISWRDVSLAIFPAGGFDHGISYPSDQVETIALSGNFEAIHTRDYSDGSIYSYIIVKNYPKGWNDKNYIEIKYTQDTKEAIQNILKSIIFGEVEDSIDAVSSELYGERVGLQGSVQISAKDWLTEKNNVANFSFRYPKDAKVTNEGNCYRVEHGLGFVIFFLPTEGDMRCGARTGVGRLPDNVDITDHLTIRGEKYEAPGFHAVIDTKEDRFFKPKTRYFYDFHHGFDLNKSKNCGNASGCRRVGYGIYEEVDTPLNKEDINDTMDTLRAIVESARY